MKQYRLDDAIDRFIDGAMTPAERAAFLATMQRDRAVAEAVEAERAIRAALAADRASLPLDDAGARVELIEALSILPKTSGGAAWHGARALAPAIASLVIVAIAVVALLPEGRTVAPPQGPAIGEIAQPRSDAPSPAPIARETRVSPSPSTPRTKAAQHTERQRVARPARAEAAAAPSDTSPVTTLAPESPVPVVVRDSFDLEVRLGAQ
jgi:hypothetical protein